MDNIKDPGHLMCSCHKYRNAQNERAHIRAILLRYLLAAVDYTIEHDGTPVTREQWVETSIEDLLSELQPFISLPLLWLPMAELKGMARTILTAAPDALTRCYHFDPNASNKRPGFQPTHFCEVPPGAPNAKDY